MEVLSQAQLWDYLKSHWRQGEHISLIGQSGTGKTTLAAKLLDIRGYVVVTAVKRRDETLTLFRRKGYKTIGKWPPDYGFNQVILWKQPKSLSDDLGTQRAAIHKMLNAVYLDGGWCVYLDDTGYLASTLRLATDIGVLLNQARSNRVSVVVGMTRPSSVIARIPKETLNQVRHVLVFKYSNIDEIESCAKVAGISRASMSEIQALLQRYPNGNTDCLYVGKENMFIVTP